MMLVRGISHPRPPTVMHLHFPTRLRVTLDDSYAESAMTIRQLPPCEQRVHASIVPCMLRPFSHEPWSDLNDQNGRSRRACMTR